MSFSQPVFNGLNENKIFKNKIQQKIDSLTNVYLGTIENGGNNKGKKIQFFQEKLKYKPGTPYCGIFIQVIYEQSGYKIGFNGAPAKNWFLFKKELIMHNGFKVSNRFPILGDVIVMHFNGSYHVGIVIKYDKLSNTVITREGNTSNPLNKKQQGIFQKIRKLNYGTDVVKIIPD